VLEEFIKVVKDKYLQSTSEEGQNQDSPEPLALKDEASAAQDKSELPVLQFMPNEG